MMADSPDRAAAIEAAVHKETAQLVAREQEAMLRTKAPKESPSRAPEPARAVMPAGLDAARVPPPPGLAPTPVVAPPPGLEETCRADCITCGLEPYLQVPMKQPRLDLDDVSPGVLLPADVASPKANDFTIDECIALLAPQARPDLDAADPKSKPRGVPAGRLFGRAVRTMSQGVC